MRDELVSEVCITCGINGPLPRGVYQCPACRHAFRRTPCKPHYDWERHTTLHYRLVTMESSL